MVLESNLNARVFLAEVAHRLHHVWMFLRDLRVGRRPAAVIPLWNVHALQAECRQLGHADLADLCASMERAIMELHLRDSSGNEEAVAQLASVCRHITERARADARGMSLTNAKSSKLLDVDAA